MGNTFVAPIFMPKRELWVVQVGGAMFATFFLLILALLAQGSSHIGLPFANIKARRHIITFFISSSSFFFF
jgi:hypothetical protein